MNPLKIGFRLLVTRYAGIGVKSLNQLVVLELLGPFPVQFQFLRLLQVLDDLRSGFANAGTDLAVVEPHRFQSEHFSNHFACKPPHLAFPFTMVFDHCKGWLTRC